MSASLPVITAAFTLIDANPSAEKRIRVFPREEIEGLGGSLRVIRSILAFALISYANEVIPF